eukprot:COSAG01_NODE_26074_length_724_cov_1.076800_1_plen_71_part_10
MQEGEGANLATMLIASSLSMNSQIPSLAMIMNSSVAGCTWKWLTTGWGQTPTVPGRGRCVSIFLDKNRRYT